MSADELCLYLLYHLYNFFLDFKQSKLYSVLKIILLPQAFIISFLFTYKKK